MKKILSISLSGLFLSLFFLKACDRIQKEAGMMQNPSVGMESLEKSSKPNIAVMPPLPQLEIPFETYTVDNSTGKTIISDRGSTIVIPSKIFIDEKGKEIQGDVTIRFREFHHAADLILSGILMTDHQNQSYMETAGMFEIEGEKDGKEIFVKPEKEIAVELISMNEGDHFDFFRLDKRDCKWDKLGTGKPTLKTTTREAIEEIEAQVRQLPKPPKTLSDAQNYIFDMQINYSKLPQFKTYENVMWEYTGFGDDPEKNEWIFQESWNEMNIDENKNGRYVLVLKNDQKEFSTIVQPVLSGNDYKKALEAFNNNKKAEVAKVLKKLESKKNALKNQKNMARVFKINSMGIYNWDVWNKMNRNKCRLAPEFDVLAGDFDKESVLYYLIEGKMRSAVKYLPENLDQFSFDPEKENILLAILPNGKVATCSSYNFKEIDLNQDKDHVEVMKMKTMKESINSVEDFHTIMKNVFLS